jgi:hypothetical protein
VTNVFTEPDTALGPVNLTNGTSTVVVPVSSTPNNEVIVHYVNSAVTSTLKVCKVLTASSGVLSGTTFTFPISTPFGNSGVSIVANTSPNGACKLFPVQLPVGTKVTVSETGQAFVGANGGLPNAGATQTVTLAAGVNTVTFSNQAYGTIEICKALPPADAAFFGATQLTFNFTVNGGASFGVKAGKCSGPIVVPVGTATITEAAKTNFSFVSSTAVGAADGLSRVVTAGNPLTVTVVMGGSANETLVTFTNKVNRYLFKLCKMITPGSLDSLSPLSYSFDVTTSNSGIGSFSVSGPYTGPGGSCTTVLGAPPVVNSDGVTPATFTTVEATPANVIYVVQSITVDGDASHAITINPAGGTAVVTPQPTGGLIIVTYTNTERLPT